MYLITKWFGTFLIEGNKIIRKKLFPKDYKIIANKLLKIEKNEILSEEKKLIQNITECLIIVNEKRLNKIGKYRPKDKFFKNFNLNPYDFDFQKDLLYKASKFLVENKLKTKLKSMDYQIIQMVNTLDSLIQILNLLSERLDNWLVIYTPKYKVEPFKKTINHIKKEMKRIENQIINDVEKIAPNCCEIIGPIITARLIALAGSMEKLSKMPASTIQLLGAENAFFRYKKEGGKIPKHGVIFQHKMINLSPKKIRGKISRLLATKLAIAIKADYYTKRDLSKFLKNEIKIKFDEIKKL
jgi:nucleolar protein 56